MTRFWTRRSTTTDTPPRRSRTARHPSGQTLVIFAFSLTALLGTAGFVVDLAWIWSNELKVQRAADAAALAGVVHLPGDVPNANGSARAESRKNGYRDGTGGVVVTPQPDPLDPRRMLVTVQAPVETFFMRLFGFNQVTVTRNAKAEFILPVPMGSPQNYYGVGTFVGQVAGPSGNTGLTAAQGGWNPPWGRAPATATTPNNWTNPTRAFTSDNSYATNASGAQQGYRDFGFTFPAGTSIIDGIVVTVEAKSSDSAGCRLGVQLSRDAGSSWTTEQFYNLTGADAIISNPGGATDMWGTTWDPTQLSNANFRIRVRDEDPGAACIDTATTSLDRITAVAYFHAAAAFTPVPVKDPSGTTLASQGFWGAVFTKGGVRQNGDRYSPAWYSGSTGTANADYYPAGYDYTLELGAGGKVDLFDAPFCGVGPNTTSGWYGAGDHWTSRPNGASPYGPVTTRYRLYNTNGTQYDSTDDTLVADSGSLFAAEYQTDQSGAFGVPEKSSADGAANCANAGVEPWHNKWWPMATGQPAGKYRLNVNTSDPANNAVAAENLFSILVRSAGQPRVYGGGRMAAYTNLAAGTQTFYLAQIDAIHAGKTMDITLFDPGDVQGPAYLRILSPEGSSYDYAVFNYTADSACNTSSDACSANNRTQIRTNSGSGSSFDNSVLTISIPLPSNYGQGGLTPPGETEAGWWKIEYEVAGGNDTTTWEVSIRGNPVHLIVP